MSFLVESRCWLEILTRNIRMSAYDPKRTSVCACPDISLLLISLKGLLIIEYLECAFASWVCVAAL